jgi:hypothetical protein
MRNFDLEFLYHSEGEFELKVLLLGLCIKKLLLFSGFMDAFKDGRAR